MMRSILCTVLVLLRVMTMLLLSILAGNMDTIFNLCAHDFWNKFLCI